MDTSTHTTPSQEPAVAILQKLLRELFASNKALLRMIKADGDLAPLAHLIPDPAISRDEFVFSVACEIESHGLTRPLIDLLMKERRGHSRRIEEAARQLQIPVIGAPPDVRLAPSIPSRPLRLVTAGTGVLAAAGALLWYVGRPAEPSPIHHPGRDGSLSPSNDAEQAPAIGALEPSGQRPNDESTGGSEDTRRPEPMKMAPEPIEDCSPAPSPCAAKSPRNRREVRGPRADSQPPQAAHEELANGVPLQLRLASKKTGIIQSIVVPKFQRADKAAARAFLGDTISEMQRQQLEDDEYALCKPHGECFKSEMVGDHFEQGETVLVKRTPGGDGYQNGAERGLLRPPGAISGQ